MAEGFDCFDAPEPDDPFGCFGTVLEDERATKRSKASPSPVLPLVRRFVATTAPNIGAALRATSVAVTARTRHDPLLTLAGVLPMLIVLCFGVIGACP